MLSDTDLEDFAARLQHARERHTPLPPFTQEHPHFDTAAGYRVAQRVQQQRVAEGATVVGRKIGFTNRELWPVYRVYEPIWGAMYDSTLVPLHDDQGRCSLAGLFEPKIEPEIAFHFASAPQPGESAASVMQRADFVAHAFEIVQSPYPGWKFNTADAAAAGSLHGLLLLGTPVPLAALGGGLLAAFENFRVTLACNGEVRDRGRGANVLGSPPKAIAHLVQAIAQRQHQAGIEPVRAGEWVTTGTLTAAMPVQPGQTWSTRIDDLRLPGLSVEFGT
jgi:2-oxo-3-hexenedioate decarboxylase